MAKKTESVTKEAKPEKPVVKKAPEKPERELWETELMGAAYLFNRSEGQCKFLYDLCDRNIVKYIELETQIKKRRIAYCPGDRKEVERILHKMTSETEMMFVEYRYKNL
jgi:hypothetical protein